MKKDKKKIIIEIDEEVVEKERSSDFMRVLVFSVGEENYCLRIEEAKEAVRLSPITRVPNTPEFVLGVINLRGEIIPLIDIRYFLSLAPAEKKGTGAVLVSDVPGESVGILVDRIKGTLKIEEASIQPPLATIKGKMAEYTIGQAEINEQILVLLDLEKILSCGEIKRLTRGGER
ncbi:MAG: chemotaxis protein CheW [Candidatus Omnitrophica bacterium]|nr:chemotaxis protein CheW [Candidatus Omnitrophota bacterium]